MTSSQIWVDSFPLASDLFLPRFTEQGLDPYLMGLHLSGPAWETIEYSVFSL